MIQINLADYPLIYYRKGDNKQFNVRRASSCDYVLVDPETKVKRLITQHMLRKEFVADVEINKSQRRGISVSA